MGEETGKQPRTQQRLIFFSVRRMLNRRIEFVALSSALIAVSHVLRIDILGLGLLTSKAILSLDEPSAERAIFVVASFVSGEVLGMMIDLWPSFVAWTTFGATIFFLRPTNGMNNWISIVEEDRFFFAIAASFTSLLAFGANPLIVFFLAITHLFYSS